jgi:transporter family protein
MEWLLLTLACALFFGLRQVFTKKMLFGEHASEYLSATCLVGFLLSLFFIPWMDFNIPGAVWGLMYLKCLLLTIGWMLGVKALRHLEISFVIPLTNITPVFLLLWAVLFLGEVPSGLQYGGVGLIIFGQYSVQSSQYSCWLQCSFSAYALLWTVW